ncbi:uncharacterized protein RCO7_14963 [Rhynchosporium graminicola]|uniref:Uncharacterized protein n=1 Tax=Rhynchosporium graminicola TaxID=2792576 RepID=A0A1E1LC57_9HELO|nr:uncharacterized protein RCO7_14963 [Rhynchosporium commune]
MLRSYQVPNEEEPTYYVSEMWGGFNKPTLHCSSFTVQVFLSRTMSDLIALQNRLSEPSYGTSVPPVGEKLPLRKAKNEGLLPYESWLHMPEEHVACTGINYKAWPGSWGGISAFIISRFPLFFLLNFDCYPSLAYMGYNQRTCNVL